MECFDWTGIPVNLDIAVACLNGFLGFNKIQVQLASTLVTQRTNGTLNEMVTHALAVAIMQKSENTKQRPIQFNYLLLQVFMFILTFYIKQLNFKKLVCKSDFHFSFS